MLRLSVTMPPPKFGKGSAFKKPGLSETARGLAAATARSASILSLEDYNRFEQPIIAKLNASACMAPERKRAAGKNLRNAFWLVRGGVDPFTHETNQCACEKKKVKSIAKDDINLIDSTDEVAKKKLQKLKEMYKPLTDWWKKFLGSQVEKVTISNKLDDDPLFILTSQYGFSATMEKVNRAQAF